MLVALLLCLQDTVPMKEFGSSYTLVKPAEYHDRVSWPVVVDLGNPRDPAREPGAFVLTPSSRQDEGFVLACLTELKTRFRVHPERVVVRGGSAALSLAVDHPDLFAACALRRPLAFSPPKKAPPCTVFLAPEDPDRVKVLAAAMVMKKSGIEVQVREASTQPGELTEAILSRLRPRGDILAAIDMSEHKRWLDASLLCIELLDKPGDPHAAKNLLKSIEGAAIIELAKVEVSVSERRWKDAFLRCREASRQFAWVPPGEKLRKRLGELESRPEVKKALESED